MVWGEWCTLRSIPACTGKPYDVAEQLTTSGVYPRMYGETYRKRRRCRSPTGLSPHVRGNRYVAGAPVDGRGSIPACTGKPINFSRSIMASTVYPRMYGETLNASRETNLQLGLSPHVRGNPADVSCHQTDGGSIPACTGKPWV